MKNLTPLSLHTPQPHSRPGDAPDFSYMAIPEAGTAPRPDIDVPAAKTHPLAQTLIRVLNSEGAARRPLEPGRSRCSAAEGPARHDADARL